MSKLPHFLHTRLTDGGEVVSLTYQLAVLYHQKILISVTAELTPRDIVWLEESGQLKN
jgi:hypothetical protein